jgi:hypothetical protein
MEKEETADVSCDFCDEAFPRKNLLKDHLIAVHNLSEADARVGAKIRTVPGALKSVPAGSGTTCPLCPKRHKFPGYLVSHLVNKHGKTEEEAKTMSGLDRKSIDEYVCPFPFHIPFHSMESRVAPKLRPPKHQFFKLRPASASAFSKSLIRPKRAEAALAGKKRQLYA